MDISMYILFYRTLVTLGAERAAELADLVGFDSVEMLEGRNLYNIPDEVSARAVRSELDKKGLKMSCYSLATEILSFNEKGELEGLAEGLIQKAQRAVPIAKELGSPYFHHTLVLNLNSELHSRRPSFDAVFDALIEGATKIAKKCNEQGMTVLYEPQGLYANGINNFGRFYYEMKRLGYDVGICGDVGNVIFADERPLDFFKKYAEEFRHVHVKDYKSLGKIEALEKGCLRSKSGVAYMETYIGDGVVDFCGCMDVLKNIGYKGAISLEMETLGDDPISESRKAIKKINEIFVSERK